MGDVAAYLRVSDPDKETKALGEAIGTDDPTALTFRTQLAEIRRKASANGDVIDDQDVYRDCHTGADWDNRPEFNRMREGVEKGGKYRRVYVWRLDRIGRDWAQQVVTLDRWERKHRCEVVSATEDLSDKTAQGKLLRNTLANFAEFERAIISERTQSNKRTLIREGKALCQGLAKFGYDYDRKTRTRILVPEEAEVVRRIFQLAADGLRFLTIAEKLNAEGVPSPSVWKKRKTARTYKSGGKEIRPGKVPLWRHDTIKEILTDASYVGAPLYQNKTALVGDYRPNSRKSQVARPQEEWIATSEPSPRIVTDELWNKVQALIAKGRATSRVAKNSHPRLLRDLIFCGVCGRPMTSSYGRYGGKTPTKVYYACQTKYRRYQPKDTHRHCGNGLTPVEWADEEVWRRVAAKFSDPEATREWVTRALEEIWGTSPDWRGQAEEHRAQVKEAEDQIKTLMASLGRHKSPTVQEALAAQVDTLSQQADAHREALAALERKVVELQDREEVLKRYEDWAAEVSAWMVANCGDPFLMDPNSFDRPDFPSHLSFEEKRKRLMAIGLKVIAKGRELTLEAIVAIEGFSS